MTDFLSVFVVPEGVTLGLFVQQLLFAYGAATVMFIRDVQGRRVSSQRSPRGFSWRFLAVDNALRVIGGAPVIYFAVYFAELFLPADASVIMRMGASVVAGAFSDTLWRSFEKWGRDRANNAFGNERR